MHLSVKLIYLSCWLIFIVVFYTLFCRIKCFGYLIFSAEQIALISWDAALQNTQTVTTIRWYLLVLLRHIGCHCGSGYAMQYQHIVSVTYNREKLGTLISPHAQYQCSQDQLTEFRTGFYATTNIEFLIQNVQEISNTSTYYRKTLW